MADDPSQSVADLSAVASAKVDPIASDPNIIPTPESANTEPDRPVSTILADPPIEPKTPLADPGSDYTVATESASIASSPSTVPAEPETPTPSVSPSQSATAPTEAQREATPPPPPPESVEGGSIQDSLPSDKPSQVQPEVPVSAPNPEASQTQEIPSESAEIKPEPPQGTQNAPLADSDSQKSSFGDLVSDQPKPISPPVSPQLPQSPQAPISSFGDLGAKVSPEESTITIEPIEPPKPVQPPLSPLPAKAPAKEGASPQTPTETIVEAKADFSAKRQQALQTRRRKRDDHLAKILVLISQKGKINNNDIVALLRVSQSTATNYLHSLVKDGKIKKEGKAKATVYLY